MRKLYSSLLYCATPFVLLRLQWRARKNPAYGQRWCERFGHISQLDKPSIWLHAVSLGETLTAIPLIKYLLEHYPQYHVVVTTMTPTGSEQVIKHFADQVIHCYVPYDLPSVVKRFLDRIQPKLCIIMETELWANILYQCRQRNVPILLANARLSARSLRGYQHIAKLSRQMMQCLSIVAAQTQDDGQRFVKLGLTNHQLNIVGNIKFDITIADSVSQQGQQLKQQWSPRPSLIAASTHHNEEQIILEAFKKIRTTHPDLLLLLVPRHPERFDEIYELCCAQGWKTVRRSTQAPVSADTDIYLGDTMGELKLLYAASDIAFVGGSFAPIGGHNLIEPAALKVPVISGPHLHNFMQVKQLLLDAQGLQIVNNAQELCDTVCALLSDQPAYQRYAAAAYQVSQDNQGSLAKHQTLVNQLLVE